MVKISIIMPVYNVEDYLDRAIKSILDQTYENWELIIVNDGSTDQSGEISDSYDNRYDKIKVLHQDNAGSGAARKKGMNYCKGEYICFVDPDDFISEEALNNNVGIINLYKPDIIFNGYTELRKDLLNKTYLKENKPSVYGLLHQKEFRMKFNEIERVGSRALWNKLYKKSFLIDNDINFTDQRVGQDALFNYEVYKYVETLFINDKCYYTYDSLRENSAVKTFKSDRFLYEIRIVHAYASMFREWDLTKIYSNNISLAYWKAIFVELLNINFKTSPYNTMQKKIDRLEEIRSEKEVQKNIKYLDSRMISNPLYSLSFELYKRRWDKVLLNIIKLYVSWKFK